MVRLIPEQVEFERVGFTPGQLLKPVLAIIENVLSDRPGDFWIRIIPGFGVLLPNAGKNLVTADFTTRAFHVVSGT